MKTNREVNEEHVVYAEIQHGQTFHVECQHIPSGLIGKATKHGSVLQARNEARENLQAILEARWLP